MTARVLAAIFAGLGRQPFVLLFVVVAVGCALGGVKVKGVGLGTTAATLVVGLGVSLLGARHGIAYALPEFASTVFFNLFMFSIGMKVGPQFISGLRRDAGKFIVIALLLPLLSVASMFLVKALFHLAPGTLAGIFAGANTATPGLGAAQAALGAAQTRGGVPAAEAQENLAAAFALSYCLSMTVFTLCAKVPDLLGKDTAGAAREFEESLRGADDAPLPGTADEFFGGPLPVALRTYDIEGSRAVGHRLGELRGLFPTVSIERVLRAGHVLDPLDDVVLEPHDTVSLFGRTALVAEAGGRLGNEVYESEARVGTETVNLVVESSEMVGRTLREIVSGIGHGLYLNALFRAGEVIPKGPEVTVRRGDVMRVTGSPYRIRLLETRVGPVIRPSVGTDIFTLALGLTVGALVGAVSVHVGNVRLTLGSAVGLLLSGITLSALRTRYPALGGPYPEPARQLIEDLGLTVFIAVLGINSGPGIVRAVEQGAIVPIVTGCLAAGFLPPLAGWIVGERWLALNPALLLGAVTGARCNSAGLRAAQETTASTVPALSYPVTFALSNLVLTVLSYVLALIG